MAIFGLPRHARACSFLRTAALVSSSAAASLAIIHAQSNLVLDPSLDVALLDPAAVRIVAVLPLPGGDTLVAGQFLLVNGVARGPLVRLQAGGTPDPAFGPVDADGAINQIAAGPGGTIYVSGEFSAIDGVARPGLARLLADGALDATFDPPGALGRIYRAELQMTSDGGVYVAQSIPDGSGLSTVRVDRYTTSGAVAPGFTPIVRVAATLIDASFGPSDTVVIISVVNGANAFNETVRRYSGNGVRDAGFQPPPALEFNVNVALVHADGSLILGGSWYSAFGPGLVRLFANGTRDESFAGTAPFQSFGAQDLIRLSDGSYVIAAFGLMQAPPPKLMHFSATGEYDAGFATGGRTTPESGALWLRAFANGDFLVFGEFAGIDNESRAHLAQFSPGGQLRPALDAAFNGRGTITQLVPLGGASMLAAGSFAQFDEHERSNIVRLGVDDAVDTSFPTTDGPVRDIFIGSDGRAVVLGDFSAVPGTTKAGIFRINSTNVVDATLLAGVSLGGASFGSGAALSDGSIVVVGGGYIFNPSVPGIVRILATGEVDGNFQLNTSDTSKGPNGPVLDVAVDASNRILLTGGDFFSGMIIQNVTLPGIARTDASGVLDPLFAPTAGLRLGGGMITPLPNGSLFALGVRTDAAPATVPGLHRFNANGTIDGGFALAVQADDYPTAYIVTPDGALLVAIANLISGENRVGRFTLSGQNDPSFSLSLGRSGFASALAFDGQGRLWLGGSFSEVNGQPRIGLARLAPPALFAGIAGPAQVEVVTGGGHTLNANVAGATGAVSYQWNFEGLPIPGATGAGLAITAFSAAQAGSYTVTVTNAGATVTSGAVRVILPVAPAITSAPQSRAGSIGGALVLRVTASGLPAPVYQWFKDGTAIAGATASTLHLRNLTAADAGSYTVQVTNIGGSALSSAAIVTLAGVGIDPGFAPAVVGLSSSTHVGVAAGAADNSLLVATYAGEALNGVSRSGLSRLHANGVLDPSFALPDRNFASPLLVQPDGTAFVFEDVSTLTSSGNYLRRVLPSGQVDPTFSPLFPTSYQVQRVGTLADGRVVAAGSFDHVNGEPHTGIVRLLGDGTVDPSFNPGAITHVAHAVIHSDGAMAVVLQEGNQWILRRLLATGAVDATFPDVTITGGFGGPRVELLADGSYLLLGHFDTVSGVARHRCARILATGELAGGFADLPGTGSVLAARVMTDGVVRTISIDSGFSQFFRLTVLSDTGAVVLDRTYEAASVYGVSQFSVAIQPDGGVVFGGPLLAWDGHPVAGMVRVDPAGNFDASFVGRVGMFDQVYATQPLPGGRWVLFGRFTEVAGVARPGVAIVGPDGTVDASFVPELPPQASISRGHVLAGGRLLIFGFLPPMSGGSVQEFVRVLHPDGSRDAAHDALLAPDVTVPAVSPEGHVYLLAPVLNAPLHPAVTLSRLRPDLSPDPTFSPLTIQSAVAMHAVAGGEIFLFTESGTLTDAAGQSRTGLVRVGNNGLIDLTFNAPELSNPHNVLPQDAPNGQYIIAGTFTQVNGISRHYVARLNRDGSLDPTFVPPSIGVPAAGGIDRFAVDASGRVLVYGRYLSSTPAAPNVSVLTRLNADGSWDPSVDYQLFTFIDQNISAMVPRENGDVMLAGRFVGLGGGPHLSLARLTSHRFQAHGPRGQVAIPLGGDGYLELKLTGPVNLPAYAWTRDGLPVPDGDRAVLALRNFSGSDVGAYRAEVTSADGSVVPTETIEVVLSEATVAVAQTPLTFSETGGFGGVRVDAPSGTSWSITGVPPWIQINAMSAATGSRTVSFHLEPNLTGGERAASVTLAGQEFGIRQLSASGRLVNISTRGRVGVGEEVLIVGIVTTGSQPLDFLGRGVGPTLANFGVGGVLPNPALDLKRGQMDVGMNDDWDAGGDRDEILAESRRLFAFDLADGQGDAAILRTLVPGGYTARIFDPAGGQGVALAEFYDRTAVAAMDPYTRAINISTRGRVGVGDDVLIAGFVVTGATPKQVLIRGVGPGLAQFGIVDHLTDPFIRVVRNGTTVAQNDDWAFSSQADLVEAAFARSNAFGLNPEARDAALVVTLDPGAYTAILSGADGGQGVAIVEVYDLE